MSLLISLLALVVWVKLVFFRFWSHSWSKFQTLFFSLQVFLLKLLLLLAGEKLNSFIDDKAFSTGLLQGFWVEKASNLAKVEWACQLPYWQYWFILHRIDSGWRLAFTLSLIVFLTNSSQLLYSRSCYSIWAFINSLRPLRKNQIRFDFFGAFYLSNSWGMD